MITLTVLIVIACLVSFLAFAIVRTGAGRIDDREIEEQIEREFKSYSEERKQPLPKKKPVSKGKKHPASR